MSPDHQGEHCLQLSAMDHSRMYGLRKPTMAHWLLRFGTIALEQSLLLHFTHSLIYGRDLKELGINLPNQSVVSEAANDAAPHTPLTVRLMEIGGTMCRNIKTLFNFDPPATDEEIRASALQFVRKLSGFNNPSRTN